MRKTALSLIFLTFHIPIASLAEPTAQAHSESVAPKQITFQEIAEQWAKKKGKALSLGEFPLPAGNVVLPESYDFAKLEKLLNSYLDLHHLMPTEDAATIKILDYRSAEKVWTSDVESAAREAKSKGKPILIKLWADWCEPCKVQEKTFYEMQLAKIPLMDKFVLATIDIDQPEANASSFLDKHKILENFMLPTLIVTPDLKTQKFSKLTGLTSRSELEAKLSKL